MPRLILLNGPPGVGKSTLGRRLADRRALTLLLDIDVVRTLLGDPDRGRPDPDVTASWLAARALAVAMARAHLTAGLDVVVPQYLGRPEFIGELAEVAAACSAEFVEVALVIDPDAGRARFDARGDVPQLVGGTETYPQMHARLTALLAARPHVVQVDATGGVDRTVALLGEALGVPATPGAGT